MEALLETKMKDFEIRGSMMFRFETGVSKRLQGAPKDPLGFLVVPRDDCMRLEPILYTASLTNCNLNKPDLAKCRAWMWQTDRTLKLQEEHGSV